MFIVVLSVVIRWACVVTVYYMSSAKESLDSGVQLVINLSSSLPLETSHFPNISH